MARAILVVMTALFISGCASEITYYKRGVQFEKKGEYAKAMEAYRKSITRDPNYALSYFGLGSVYSKNKLWDASLENLLKARDMGIDDQDIHMLLGSVYEAMGKTDLAAEEYGRAIKARPDDVLSHLKLGATMEKSRDFEGALVEYRAASSIVIDFPEAYFHAGRMLVELGRSREAEEALGQALKLNKKYAAAQNELTILRIRQNRIQNAFESAKKTLDIDAGYVPGMVNMGYVFELMNDQKAAMQWYVKALRRNPDSDMAHYRLGILKKKMGDGKGAKEEFMAAVQANSSLSSALNELGILSLGDGDYTGAFDYFSDAAAADSTFSDAYYNMAGIRMNMGNYSSAAEYYRKYLDFAGNPEDSSEVRARIDILSSRTLNTGGNK